MINNALLLKLKHKYINVHSSVISSMLMSKRRNLVYNNSSYEFYNSKDDSKYKKRADKYKKRALRVEKKIDKLSGIIAKNNEKLENIVIVEQERNLLYVDKLKKSLEDTNLSSNKKNKISSEIEKHEIKSKVISDWIEIKEKQDRHLVISNLSMHFGGLKAVNNLSFDVKKGEIFGLIGPNGAGKTTVFNCITQFYKPVHGEIFFIDRFNQVQRLSNFHVKDVISLGLSRTFQNVELIIELNVLDNLLIGAHSLHDSNFIDNLIHTPKLRRENNLLKQRAINVLQRLNLIEYAYSYPLGLPYGVLKKIELARSLMTNPSFIILDEPAAGLNEQETKELAETIKAINKDFRATILLVEHDMDLVMNVCNRICAISFGQMLAIGSPNEIKNNKLVQEAYLGGDHSEK